MYGSSAHGVVRDEKQGADTTGKEKEKRASASFGERGWTVVWGVLRMQDTTLMYHGSRIGPQGVGGPHRHEG